MGVVLLSEMGLDGLPFRTYLKLSVSSLISICGEMRS